MVAKIIDGKSLAAEIRRELRAEMAKLEKRGIIPALAALLVGEDSASLAYLRGIGRGCGEVGIYMETIKLPREIKEAELLLEIEKLNSNSSFHGIMIQFPLPQHLNVDKVVSAISPQKDVDGANPISLGRLLMGEETFIPSTPAGIQQLLVRSGYEPSGKHVVICGRSNIVGKPLMGILIQKQVGANATVTICHTETRDLPSITRQADILVVAVGRPKAITREMVKEGVVVIDVGMNTVEDPSSPRKFRFIGDVDFDAVSQKAVAITPVPGGVGPMTVTMLMANTIKAAEMTAGSR